MKSVRLSSGEKFTPGKIIGVGRNYRKHIEEMKAQPGTEPVLFLKPNSALHELEQPVPLPSGLGEVHHEIELAVLLGRAGSRIGEDQAADYILGFGVALDLTLRDVQNQAKQNGLPWAVAKGFDHSCPVSVFAPANPEMLKTDLELVLKINGQIRQRGRTCQMIFSVPFLISYISRFFTLEPGDIILTGTPDGVGPLSAGDELDLSVDLVGHYKTRVLS